MIAKGDHAKNCSPIAAAYKHPYAGLLPKKHLYWNMVDFCYGDNETTFVRICLVFLGL
jgi:hypothetical protein